MTDRVRNLVDAVITFSGAERASVADIFDSFNTEDHPYVRHAVWGITNDTGLILRQEYDTASDSATLFIIENPQAHISEAA